MTDTQPSGATTTGPTSFSDLPSGAWSDASSASTPSPESTTTASASADTTVPPVANAPSEALSQQTGEPPKERWPDILENARTKAGADALAKYAGLDRFTPEQWTSIAPWIQRAQTDPIGFLVSELTDHPQALDVLQQAISKLQGHATHGPALKSLAARALAARTPSAEKEPQLDTIPVQLEDGRIVQFVTAESQQKREAWVLQQAQQQAQQQADQKLQPLQQTVDKWQAQQAAVSKQQDIARYVDSTYKDVLTWPGMDDPANQKAVAEAMKTLGADEHDPREVSLALNTAYRQKVLPTLSQKTEAKLLDSLKTKAAASTGVNPGSAAPSSPQRYDRFDQLPAEAWR